MIEISTFLQILTKFWLMEWYPLGKIYDNRVFNG